MLSFTTDRTGFPLVVVKALKLDVHLFPVLKQQFEMFLAEPNPFDDVWYETILEMNPRGHGAGDDQLEQLFLTGILPSEAMSFAAWLGKGYRLPTDVEWKIIYERFTRERRPKVGWTNFVLELDQAAKECIEALLHCGDGSLLATLSRMDDGVMEWIHGRPGWQLIGQPRPSFGRQLFSCRSTVAPTNAEHRNKFCGFRLVRNHRE
jgi:hypothetical protein